MQNKGKKKQTKANPEATKKQKKTQIQKARKKGTSNFFHPPSHQLFSSQNVFRIPMCAFCGSPSPFPCPPQDPRTFFQLLVQTLVFLFSFQYVWLFFSFFLLVVFPLLFFCFFFAFCNSFFFFCFFFAFVFFGLC